MYEAKDYIETAPDGQLFGQRGEYKYRVMGRTGFPSHHTNCLDDATSWFEMQRDYWLQKDELVNGHLQYAVSLFESLKAEYLKRYMARERVSLAMMAERETFEQHCDWAVKVLRSKFNDI